MRKRLTNGLVKMTKMSYNYTSSNRIKSDGSASTPRHPFDTYVRGVDTMSDITLPLFSLQPETKEIPLSQGKVAIVDAADYEWLMQWNWYALHSWNGLTWYARRNDYSQSGKRTTVSMHRAILGAPQGIEVDHKDGNGLNNTRDNLRLATHRQNQQNRRGRSNTASGYKGVVWNKKKRKWLAYIGVNGKATYSGSFVAAEEAARAYDAAARKAFGEFAWLNFPDSES